MLVSLILTLLLPHVVVSNTSIDDVKRLFDNTIARWGVKITGKRDYQERFNRLVQAKKSVDSTATGVHLEFLNRFSVNNNAEQRELESLTRAQSNRTMEHLASLSDGYNTAEMISTVPGRLEKRWGLPDEFNYWEKELGLHRVEDQMGCGSCWVFPGKVVLEALYKQLTGDDEQFSAQFFVDCTYSYTGCVGGESRTVFNMVRDTQYVMGEADFPYTADYQPCQFRDKIKSGEGNRMHKAWLQSWYPVGNNEEAFLNHLFMSPVSFASYISSNYFSYSGGIYSDPLCALEATGHAQLLVGYTEKYMRVRGSYGHYFGENGYINYKRNSPHNLSCRFFQFGYVGYMAIARDIEYVFCADAKAVTRDVCRESCLSMNKEGETGWDLAVVPTKGHSERLCAMANERWPGVKKFDDRFNLLWIGAHKNANRRYVFNGGTSPYQVAYFFYQSPISKRRKYVLVNKNSGVWITKDGWEIRNYKARGFCSRIRTCYDFTSQLAGLGSVSYSTGGELVEGSTAHVTCESGYIVEGNAHLTCIAGQWNGDDSNLPKCV